MSETENNRELQIRRRRLELHVELQRLHEKIYWFIMLNLPESVEEVRAEVMHCERELYRIGDELSPLTK